jgi:hypothetical protein
MQYKLNKHYEKCYNSKTHHIRYQTTEYNERTIKKWRLLFLLFCHGPSVVELEMYEDLMQ